MNENDNGLFVGNGKQTEHGFKISIDVDKFKALLTRDDVDVRTWTDKAGNEHKEVSFFVNAKREEYQTQYQTHSVKAITKR